MEPHLRTPVDPTIPLGSPRRATVRTLRREDGGQTAVTNEEASEASGKGRRTVITRSEDVRC